MSSDAKIPDWAREASMCITLIPNAGHPTNVRAARALLASEQRGRKAGIEEAAKVAEGYYDHVTDALRDAQDPVAVEVQMGIAAAIRSLGEKI